MRIALLQPSYWPEVRRGSERVVHDLGTMLAARGHEVTLITSHPGAASIEQEEGMRVIRTRRPRTISPMRWYEDHIESVPAMSWHLLRGRYDVANAFFPSYAWGAVRARRLGGPPVVFSFHGIPIRRYLVARRYRLEMLQAIVAGAAASTVLSQAAADAFRRYLLRQPVVLPAGYLRSEFEAQAELRPEPTLVCAASLDDPRKRGELLLAAFAELRSRRPEARLQLVPHDGAGVGTPTGPALPDGVELVQARTSAELARIYAAAHASVLAAPGEALGLVLIEALAAGTPVVAADSGAGPELVNDDRIGRLFASDDREDLARAMGEALELAGEAETAGACRERAREYDWERLIEPHESLLESVADAAGPVR